MVADDYSGTGYTKPLRLRSEAVDDIKVIKAAAENMAQNKLREVMPGDQCASYPCARCTRFAQRAALSSIGQPHIGLHPIVYTEGAISVLTNTLRAVLYNTGLPKFLWAQAFGSATDGISTTECRRNIFNASTPYECARCSIAKSWSFGVACVNVEKKEYVKELDDRVTYRV